MGASGSGKSTLLYLIGGLDKPTKGELFLNGISLNKLKDSKLDSYRNEYIGFVFQNYKLYNFLLFDLLMYIIYQVQF